MKRARGIGFVTAITLAIGAPGAVAASPHHHHRTSALGGSCQGAASAIAQYCEVIPTARGGEHPGPGTPTLLSTLPSRAVRRIAPLPTRPLLRIPAAAGLPASGVRGLVTP